MFIITTSYRIILYFNRRINSLHVNHKTFETDAFKSSRILNREIIVVHAYHKTAETDEITMI